MWTLVLPQPGWPLLDVFQVTESFQNVWGGICFRKGGWSMRSGANIWRTASRLISWNSHTLWEIPTKGVIWKSLTEGIQNSTKQKFLIVFFAYTFCFVIVTWNLILHELFGDQFLIIISVYSHYCSEPSTICWSSIFTLGVQVTRVTLIALHWIWNPLPSLCGTQNRFQR